MIIKYMMLDRAIFGIYARNKLVEMIGNIIM